MLTPTKMASWYNPMPKPGDIRFKDLNHDGVLDENDKTWIGNPYPDLMVGLNLGFSY